MVDVTISQDEERCQKESLFKNDTVTSLEMAQIKVAMTFD